MQHFSGLYYHIYNRGTNREPIFTCEENYLFLLRQIKHFLPYYHLAFIAYCLMPNHYHFLIRVEADGELSPFIQRLFNSYTQAFNRQHHRSGTLFEGRAKSKLIDEDSYVVHLVRYIHLNPVQAGLVKQAKDWPFSNYQEWIGQRPGTLYDPGFVKDNFPTPGEYENFVVSELSVTLEKALAAYYLDKSLAKV